MKRLVYIFDLIDFSKFFANLLEKKFPKLKDFFVLLNLRQEK